MVTQRIKNGLLLEIDLGNGFVTFGRVLSKAEIGFYDFKKIMDESVDFELIYKSPVFFVVSVMNYAVKQGRWKIVDFKPLEPLLEGTRYYFMRDGISGAYSIYNAQDGSIRNAKPGEEIGLEQAAVWDPEHIEERLRKHFFDSQR